MWVDREGVCHSVALPDPTVVMSEVFLEHLGSLLDEGGWSVRNSLEEKEGALFTEEFLSRFSDLTVEEDFIDEPPCRVLLMAPMRTLGDLRESIDGVDPRWRLDAILALQDYVA